MAADTSRLRFGDLIAGGSALALFIFMLFPWYKGSASGFGQSESESESAWGALGFGKIFLLLLILVVIAAVVVRLLGMEAQIPVPLGAVITAAGALATLYILWRIIDLPGEIGEAADAVDELPDGFDVDIGRAFGIFLAFLAAIAMTVGGVLSMRERGEAIPGVGDGGGAGPGAGAGGGGPLGTGQPAGDQPAAGAPAAGQPAGATSVATPTAGDAGASEANDQAGGAPKPDWYPDPEGKARLRYWDGTQWTDQTAD